MNRLKDGYLYWLPTEAEWEYAARAGTEGPYFGILNEIAWWEGNSGGRTHSVGQKQANGFGLYDMIENAEE
jgi:formylglycine-generating enzyme required for sulfatase activity